jgi:hypothetical protein
MRSRSSQDPRSGFLEREAAVAMIGDVRED